MATILRILILSLSLQAAASAKRGPDFNGNWTVQRAATANVPICNAIARNLMSTEKALVVEQTPKSLRVVRSGTNSHGQSIVKEMNYSLEPGKKSDAQLHGRTLTITREVVVSVDGRVEKYQSVEDWYFKEDNQTLAVSLTFRMNNYVLFYRRTPVDKGTRTANIVPRTLAH